MMISKSEAIKSDTPIPSQTQKQDTGESDFESLLNPRGTQKDSRDDGQAGDKIKRQDKGKNDSNASGLTCSLTMLPAPIPAPMPANFPSFNFQSLTADQSNQKGELSVQSIPQNVARDVDVTDVDQSKPEQTEDTKKIDPKLLLAEMATKEINPKIEGGAASVKPTQQDDVKSDVAKNVQPVTSAEQETSADKKINAASSDVLSIEVTTNGETSAPVAQVTNAIEPNKVNATASKTSTPVLTSNADQNQIAAVKPSSDTDAAKNQTSDQQNPSQSDLASVTAAASNGSNGVRANQTDNHAATFGAQLDSSAKRNTDQKIDASGVHNLTTNISSAASKDLAGPVQSKESVSATQVIDQLTANVKPTTTELKLVLNPENLGLLQLKISSANGHIAASITASSDAVRQALEHNLPQLHAALAEQGLKVSHVSVDTQTSQFSQFSFTSDGYGSANQGQPQQKSSSFTLRPDASSEQQIDAPVHAVVSTSHSLNIIA